MSEILFSVIIPLYNKEMYIKDTIQQVLKQTIQSFEVIVVNDGSTDKSEEKVSTILDKRIRLINQNNQGVAVARNRGIKEARGKYVCFLDADDIWKEDFLEVTYNLFLQFPEAKMACPSYCVSYGDRVVNPVWRSVDLQNNSLVNDFFEMATGSFWVCNSSCIAIEREALLKMSNYFPEGETVYEDFDLWIRLGAKYIMAHSNQICAVYQRITDKNARKAHENKVVYSKTYMNTLETLYALPERTEQQRYWIREIKDRRMVPYIFSLLCIGEKKIAREVMASWKPTQEYSKYYLGLKLVSYIPGKLIRVIQSVRYKLF